MLQLVQSSAARSALLRLGVLRHGNGEAQEIRIDFNKARMRRVAEAILALSWRPNGFTSSPRIEKAA
jgi:hypothetical protein